MGWAARHIEKLKEGEPVSFRPTGGSMKGRIEPGQLCTVQPVTDPSQLAIDDIVLCKVAGNDYLHLIKAIDRGRFLIGNNRGGINGWVGAHGIYGKATKIEG